MLDLVQDLQSAHVAAQCTFSLAALGDIDPVEQDGRLIAVGDGVDQDIYPVVRPIVALDAYFGLDRGKFAGQNDLQGVHQAAPGRRDGRSSVSHPG